MTITLSLVSPTLAIAPAVSIKGVSMARKVTLSEIGGGVSVTGETLSFDGETTVTRTTLGKLQLDTRNSACDGIGSPFTQNKTSYPGIAGGPTRTDQSGLDATFAN